MLVSFALNYVPEESVNFHLKVSLSAEEELEELLVLWELMV
jgi:hypothetical protein